MRKPLDEGFQNSARKITIPAPTRGINARDPFISMRPGDAIYLDNFWPQLNDVSLRKGWTNFASVPTDTVALPHNIRTLMSYAPPSGSDKLFAATEAGIYDVTAGGAIADPPAAACTNGSWETINMTTPGGSYLWLCNGVDDCWHYSGSAWAKPTLTGITSADVSNVSIFKNRIILTKKASLSFFYLGLNSIAGAAAEFPLGSLFNLGGYLLATTTWTIDSGEGADDYFVALTNKGEVAVYKGTDPSSATTFALVGIYRIPTPLGKRCFVRLSGDVGVLTVEGLFPLSKALAPSIDPKLSAFSYRIVALWKAYAEDKSSLFGWQAVVFPEASMLLVNIPVVFDAALNIAYSYQLAMNTSTGAWSRFLNQHAECWCWHANKLYFANHNQVNRAWVGEDDNGGLIDARVKTAFDPLTQAANKRITLIRPLMIATANIAVQLGIDTDFNDASTVSSTATYAAALGKWDTAKWDEAKWAANFYLSDWRSVSHRPGSAVSLRLRLAVKNVTLTWNATALLCENTSGLL